MCCPISGIQVASRSTDLLLPTHQQRELVSFFALTALLVTPGPGTYLLPSDFGYLIDTSKTNTRVGTSNTQSRGRNVNRLKLSTLQAGENRTIDGFESTDREGKFVNKSLLAYKSKNTAATNASTLQETSKLMDDSIDQSNLLTQREDKAAKSVLN